MDENKSLLMTLLIPAVMFSIIAAGAIFGDDSHLIPRIYEIGQDSDNKYYCKIEYYQNRQIAPKKKKTLKNHCIKHLKEVYDYLPEDVDILIIYTKYKREDN